MDFTEIKSINELSEKDLLKAVFINQMQIVNRISKLEKSIDKSIIGDSSDVSIKKTIQNIESFEKQINSFLKSNFTE